MNKKINIGTERMGTGIVGGGQVRKETQKSLTFDNAPLPLVTISNPLIAVLLEVLCFGFEWHNGSIHRGIIDDRAHPV